MTKEKPVNYTKAQEALIVEAIEANGGVADKSVAETLAADSRMNNDDGPRSVRSIIAKMRRVVETNDAFSYARVVPKTKDGKDITRKIDLVARIAALAGVTAKALDGLEKAPKPSLETLRDAFARTGTEG